MDTGFGGNVEVWENGGASDTTHSIEEGTADVAIISCLVKRGCRDVVGGVWIGGHVVLNLDVSVEVRVKGETWWWLDTGPAGHIELIGAAYTVNSVEIRCTSTANGVVFKGSDVGSCCQHFGEVSWSTHPPGVTK